MTKMTIKHKVPYLHPKSTLFFFTFAFQKTSRTWYTINSEPTCAADLNARLTTKTLTRNELSNLQSRVTYVHMSMAVVDCYIDQVQ